METSRNKQLTINERSYFIDTNDFGYAVFLSSYQRKISCKDYIRERSPLLDIY